jgi:uncharacterized protein DUF732
MRMIRIAAAGLAAAGLLVIGCGGTTTPATHTTTPASHSSHPAAVSASPSPGSAAFLAGFRNSGLGAMDIAGATDDQLLKIGQTVCHGFRGGVTYGDEVLAFTESSAKPTTGQADTLVRLAVVNLCPQYGSDLP